DVLTNLQKNIQSFINLSTNQFSSTEFTNQITSDTFRDELARVLSIKKSQIGTITFINDILKIQPINMQKFVSSESSPLLVDNNIQVSGFNFFSAVIISSPQNLYDFVNNYITNASRKYTVEEFGDFIKTNDNQFKLNIAKSLTKQSGGTVTISEISNIELDGKNLAITLDGSQDAFFKYSVSSNNNVVVENGSLVVKNLTYYLDLTISDEKLKKLRVDVNNFISDNKITVGPNGDINNYLNYGIFNYFKNVDTKFNGKLGQYINSPNNPWSSTGKGNNIGVNTNNSNLYKMTSKYLNNGEIIVSGNNISLNHFQFEWDEQYFLWSGNEITGISSSGQSLINSGITNIVVPKRCVGLVGTPFSGSNGSSIMYKVTEIDLRLTSISKLINDSFRAYDRVSDSMLEYVYLPDSVTQLESQCFSGCAKLKYVELPKNLSLIATNTFIATNNLQLVLPSSLINKINASGAYNYQGQFGPNNFTVYLQSSSDISKAKTIFGSDLLESNIIVDPTKFS
ncbi:MAG: leucine-rich repeat domain-containing protein, partial [Ureaplasma sp.]|nr:leucine-rich repeat domain-containing protein [Ureaplasma sp.]